MSYQLMTSKRCLKDKYKISKLFSITYNIIYNKNQKYYVCKTSQNGVTVMSF